MIEDLVGLLAGGVLKLIGQFFAEVVYGFLIQGAGYVVCRCLGYKREISEGIATFVGIIFWIGVVALIYGITRQL